MKQGQMTGIKGELSSLSVTDLIQWIEMNKKTGVLFLKSDGKTNCVCFKEGSVLLASSNEDGHRLGDFLMSDAHIPIARVEETLSRCRTGGDFVAALTESKAVPAEFMKVVIEHVAESVIIDVLSWAGGSFHFIESLPKFLDGSGVRLNASHLVFESVRKYDESRKQEA